MDFKVPLPKVVEDAIEAYREDNDWMDISWLTAVTLIRMLRRRSWGTVSSIQGVLPAEW